MPKKTKSKKAKQVEPVKEPAKKLTPEEKKTLHREKAKARYHSLTAEEKKERVRTSRYGKDFLKRLDALKTEVNELHALIFDKE